VPHDRRALIDQLRGHPRQQRCYAVVIDNPMPGRQTLSRVPGRAERCSCSATPDHVASYLNNTLRRSRGLPEAPCMKALLHRDPRAAESGGEVMASQTTAD
jgi:hypothetical protein